MRNFGNGVKGDSRRAQADAASSTEQDDDPKQLTE